MDDNNTTENKKSDILVILENIEQMLKCNAKVVNGYASNIQGMAIAVEAQALAQKLRLAADRWRKKLPFKEACDVDFKEWGKKMLNARNVNIDEYAGYYTDAIREFEPDTDFFIDQYYQIKNKDLLTSKDFPRYYETDDAFLFYEEITSCREEIEDDKTRITCDIGKNVLSQIVDEYYHSYDPEFDFDADDEKAKKRRSQSLEKWLMDCGKSFTVLICVETALEDLSDALHYAHRVLICPEESTYKDLYKRLSLAYFNELINEANDDFQKWLNSTPKKKRLGMMKTKLEKEKNKFFSGKWKNGLENFFDIDNIENVLEGTDAGKFLYRYRNDLSLDEAGRIIAQYHKIALFLREIDKMENEGKTGAAEAKEMPAQEEKKMELPVIFNSTIRGDAKATNMIVDALRELAKTTGHKSKTISGGKTWGHVKEYLMKNDYIANDCSGAAFGRAIEAICTDKTRACVEQSLKRYNNKMLDKNHDKTSDENIISDVGKMMDQLSRYLVTRYPQRFSKG